MLKSTFCCLRGIGESAEQRLWRRGIQTWRELALRAGECFSASTAERVCQELRFASAALDAGQADFFLSRLRGACRARILPDFRDQIGYLDIETDGLGMTATVTTAALYVQGRVRVYVNGRDLHELIPALARCGVLVTFNGAAFDLPILRRYLGINLGQAHLDLMHVLRALGHAGGLKRIEQRLGFARMESDGISGLDAVEWWRRYRQDRDLDALRRLAAYNAEDVLVLEKLLVYAFNRSACAFPMRMNIALPHAEDQRMRLLQICSLTID